MRRCAGIIRGTVSPHGDGHDSMWPSATRSAVPGRDGCRGERGPCAVRVRENATQREDLASDCAGLEEGARSVPLEHRPIARSGGRCGEPEECLPHWRDDATLRPRARRVNPHSTHRQLRDHRASANRAARRRRQCPWPGRRPGRREAESIDDGEHGASITGAMVGAPDPGLVRDATVRQHPGHALGTKAARSPARSGHVFSCAGY